jgi:hypothetical protein
MLKRTALLSVACDFAPVELAQHTLDEIREDWRARKYPPTYEETEQYRKEPYGKRLEVYYMGGTSLCRMPGQADLGTKYMQWILDNFSLSRQDMTTVQRERQACQSAASPITSPLVISFNTTLASASSSGRTKMFYYTGGENALKSVPVEVVREIPIEEFEKRLFARQEASRAKVEVSRLAGEGAVSEVSKYFVVASSQHTPGELRSIGQQLDKVYDFFLSEYVMRAPESLISVYLVPNSNALGTLSAALHGMRLSPQSIGYSYQADMMVRNNFGDVPPWLDEGMAALYEVTETRNGRVAGAPNWRGPVLQMLWSQQPPVEKLIRMNWFDFSGGDDEFNTEKQAAIHAKARYLMLYLQNEGKLRGVYSAFQSREIGADSAALLRATLRTDLGALERDFQAWFRKTNR